MSTFVIGDVHGEREQLERVLDRLPFVAPDDTLVLLGDYLDRGPDSRGVIERLRRLPEETAGKVVLLRGNHEDAYLSSLVEVDLGFVLPRGNGVLETFRSYTDSDVAVGADMTPDEARCRSGTRTSTRSTSTPASTARARSGSTRATAPTSRSCGCGSRTSTCSTRARRSCSATPPSTSCRRRTRPAVRDGVRLPVAHGSPRAPAATRGYRVRASAARSCSRENGLSRRTVPSSASPA